jgi:hypothetical protein
MKQINHKELVDIIKLACETKVPAFVWGAPGIGKSESIREAAKQVAKGLKLQFNEGGEITDENFTIVDQRLSQMDPSDLRGLPYVTKDGHTKWAYPSWLPTKGKGILLFDEINLAAPLVQSSAYQLILDRKLGDYTMPEGWSLVAAGNRAEDKAYTFEMAAPLCNRFTHFELACPAVDDWVEWALEAGVDSRIVTFLKFKPAMLYKFDSKLKDCKAFPTPRSWARYCSPMIQGNQDYRELLSIISGAVGEGVATEMLAYIKLTKTIDLDDLLLHPEKAAEITGVDLKYSLVSALAERVRKDHKTMLPKICKVVEHMEAEFAILSLRFVRATLGPTVLANMIRDDKTVATVLKKYVKYLVLD